MRSAVITKIIAICGLLKIELPLAAGLCVVVGEMLVIGKLPTPLEFALGFLAGFFISGAIMMSNDYFDLEVDKINHPERPLPSGRITIRELAALTCLFSIAGFLIFFYAGFFSLVYRPISLGGWFLYNWKFKEAGLAGNLMVSLSVAMTFIFGGVSVGSGFSGLVWVFGVAHLFLT